MQSTEAPSTSWLDVHFAVDVVQDIDGRRALHCHLTCWDRHAHIVLSLRRLIFWLALLMLVLPASAFRLMPRMPHMAAKAVPVASGSLSIPSRVHLLDNISAAALADGAGGIIPSALLVDGLLEKSSPEPAQLSLFESGSEMLKSAAEPAQLSLFESGSEMLVEELDQCILDASSEDDFTACLQQLHSSSLDELSGLIVKEGCDALGSYDDDGTVLGLVGQLLHSAKEEGLQAISFRKLALRAGVSATMHKIMVCALPVATGLLHVDAAALHGILPM